MRFVIAAFCLLAAGPAWAATTDQCQDMDRWTLLMLHGKGVVKQEGCDVPCNTVGCHDTRHICWTDSPVQGKTQAGQRYIYCPDQN